MRNHLNSAVGSSGAWDVGDPEDRPVLLPPDDSRPVRDTEDRRVLLPPDDSSERRRLNGSVPDRDVADVDRFVDGPRAHEFPPAEVPYSGFIIVRLHRDHALADAGTLETLIGAALKHQRQKLGLIGSALAFGDVELMDLRAVAALLRSEAGCPRRLVGSLCTERILDLEQAAARGPVPPIHSLAAYRRIDARSLSESEADRVVRKLNEQIWVNLAYRELAAGDPLHAPSDPYAGHQHYLDRAPNGVDACWAWQQLDGKLSSDCWGVRVIDLEQGWIEHNDLPRGSVLPSDPDNRGGGSAGGSESLYRGDHGTAVLGQLVAQHGIVGGGGVGIAPGSTVHRLSHFRGAEGTNGHVADAILWLLDQMEKSTSDLDLELEPELVIEPGDVLLLEVQRGFWPTEVDEADFDAIRLAVGCGLTVIEAAGNGGFDLDSYRDTAGRAVLARTRGAFRDSGAILVGASESVFPPDRAAFSNYGSRVDCFASGEDVVTTGYGDLDGLDTDNHTQNFGGTSSAAPIIAGAAAILQKLHHCRAGQRLSPLQLRETLSDPENGTPQGDGRPGRIGSMPDLRTIGRQLGLVPRLFLKAHPGDVLTQQTAVTCSSPDIEPSAGNIDVKVRNRGLRAASNVRVEVYASELSTLALPPGRWPVGEPAPVWQRLSSCDSEGVSPTDSIEPSGSKTFSMKYSAPSSPTPPPESDAVGTTPRIVNGTSFLVVASHKDQEPGPTMPPGSPYFRWRDYLDFLAETSRRSVIDVGPRTTCETLSLQFKILGAPDRPRSFDFEIVRHLPVEVNVVLELPRHLAVRFWRDRLPELLPEHGDAPTTLQLPRNPSLSFDSVQLSAVRSYSASLKVSGAATCPDSTLSIRQLYAGQEVGRITWRFCQEEKEDKREDVELS